MKEIVVLVMTMLSSWNVEYYPSSLDEGVVDVEYYENSTVITINRTLVPAQIECTGSMRPLMGCENKAFLERLSATEKVNNGDIVAYEKDGNYIMHQVVGFENGCFKLKGFNNIFEDDSCVERSDIKYRAVIVIPTGA